jgi:hypothetical protein
MLNKNGCERKESQSVLRLHPSGRFEKNYVNPQSGQLDPSRDLNQALLEYEPDAF